MLLMESFGGIAPGGVAYLGKLAGLADPEIPVAILSILAAAVGALLGFSSTSLFAYLLPDAGMQSLLVYAGVALLMASVGSSPCTRHATRDLPHATV